MRKINILLLVFITFFQLAFTQNTDLDRFYLKTQNLSLPDKHLPLDRRDFYINLIDRSSKINFIPEKIQINGFQNITNSNNKNNAFEITVSLPTNLSVSDPKVLERIEEKKDKDGNVLGKYYYYKVEATYTYGSRNKAYINELNINIPLSYSKNYSTSEFDSSQKAIDQYDLSKNKWVLEMENEVQEYTHNEIVRYLNNLIGYPINNNQIKLWLPGSTKNPEYQDCQEVLKTLQKEFATIKYNLVPQDITTKLQPAISVFENIIEKYSENNRKHKKMRYSSYYNLMKIYYHIDNFEKSEEYANLLFNNDYDKSDGKKFAEFINRTKENLNKNQTKTLHFKIPNYQEYSITNNEY